MRNHLNNNNDMSSLDTYMTSQLNSRKTTNLTNQKLCILFCTNFRNQFNNFLCNIFKFFNHRDKGKCFRIIFMMSVCFALWPRAGFAAKTFAKNSRKFSKRISEHGKNCTDIDDANYIRSRRSGVHLNQHNEPFQLINSAAGMYLEIRPDGTVRGTRKKQSKYTKMKLSSVDVSVVAIQGIESKRFLAIQRRGRITSTGSMRDDCRLVERMAHGSYTFHREHGDSKLQYLSMSKKGRMKKAAKMKLPSYETLFAIKAYTEPKRRRKRKKGKNRKRRRD